MFADQPFLERLMEPREGSHRQPRADDVFRFVRGGARLQRLRTADGRGVGEGGQRHDQRLVAGRLVVGILQFRVVLIFRREQADEVPLVFLFQFRAVHHHVQRLEWRFLLLEDVALVSRRNDVRNDDRLGLSVQHQLHAVVADIDACKLHHMILHLPVRLIQSVASCRCAEMTLKTHTNCMFRFVP